MAIDWDKIEKKLEGKESSSIDWNKLESRLPKKPEPIKIEPIKMPDALTNARNLYQGKEFQAYGVTTKATPKPLGFSQYNPFAKIGNQPIDIPQMKTTTPMIASPEESMNPLKAYVGSLRAVSDIATLPTTITINALSPKDKRVSVKQLVDTTLNMAREDIQSYGYASTEKVAQKYLESQKVGKYGGNKVSAVDVGVLATIGIFDLFGDLDLALPALKSAAMWKKIGGVTKELPTGSKFITSRTLRNEGLQIADNLKIKVKPKSNSVVFEGYIKRGTEFGEAVPNKYLIDDIANNVSKSTGLEVKPKISGNDLIIKVDDTAIKQPTTDKLVFGSQAIKQPEEFSDIEPTNYKEVNKEVESTIKKIEDLAKENGFKEIKIVDKGTNDLINNQPSPSGVDPATKTLYINRPQLAQDISDIMAGRYPYLDYADNFKLDSTNKYANNLVEFETNILNNATIQDAIDLRSPIKEVSDSARIRLDSIARDNFKPIDSDRLITSTKIFADKGGYSTDITKEIKTKSGKVAMETPELYELAKEIGDDIPISLNNRRASLGFFKADATSPELSLNKKLFETQKGETVESRQQRIAKTFAHEIGHYIDYLPDRNIKRGNLNARLLSLDDFKKNFIADEDKLKEVRNIKRKISELNKDEILGETEKARQLENLNNQLISLSEDIVFDNKFFKDELIKLSKEWKPWEEGVDKAYDTYRKSAPELYADFVSVLFNNPDLAKEIAPRFYNEFFRNLDNKPDVLKNFLAIQNRLMGSKESVMDARWRAMKDSGMKAQEMYINMMNENIVNRKYPWWKNIEQSAWYQHYWTKDVSKKAEYTMEIFDRGQNNDIFIFAKNKLEPIFNNLKKAGLDSNDLDAILKLERIASDTTRYDIANIKGLDQKTAEDVLKETSNIIGEDKAKVLFKSADDIRKALRELQLKYPDIFTEEQLAYIDSNKFYAPFNVLYSYSNSIPYFIKQASGNIDKDFNSVANILMRARAVINFGENNILKKTIVDELLDNNDGIIRTAKKKVFKDDKGQLHVEFEKTKKDEGLIQIKRNGKSEGYIVPKDIAESLDTGNIREMNVFFRILRTINTPFKKLYTELNPGFQLVNFLNRDFGTTAQFFEPEWVRAQLDKKGLEDIIANNTTRLIASKATQIKYYKKAFKELYQKNMNNVLSPLVEEGLKAHIIEVDGSGFYKIQPDSFDKMDEAQIKILLESMGLRDKTKGIKKIPKDIKAFGQTLEETPKLASYMYFKDLGLLAKDEEKYLSIIRNYVGSPNFWKRGKNSQEISSAFLFYNPIIRGIQNNYTLASGKDAVGKGSRQAYWWRMARTAIIPALVTVAAEEGMFDNESQTESERLSTKLKKVTEYFKLSYYVVPLKTKENGNQVFTTIPMNENSRYMYAMTRLLVKSIIDGGTIEEKAKSLASLAAYTGGQIPSSAPAIKIATAWGTALAGGNPYDKFRQQHLFSPYQEENLPAGEKAEVLLKWTFNQNGVLKLNMYDSADNRSIDEQIISSTPGLNRYLRSSQYGEYELLQSEVDRIREQKIIEANSKSKEVVDIVELIHDKKITNEELNNRLYSLAEERLGPEANDVKEINKEIKSLVQAVQQKYITSYSDSKIKSLATARDNDEKEAILIKIYEEGLVSKKEFNDLLSTAINLGLISKDVNNYVVQYLNSTNNN